jgi:hypothetical protein
MIYCKFYLQNETAFYSNWAELIWFKHLKWKIDFQSPHFTDLPRAAKSAAFSFDVFLLRTRDRNRSFVRSFVRALKENRNFDELNF